MQVYMDLALKMVNFTSFLDVIRHSAQDFIDILFVLHHFSLL